MSNILLFFVNDLSFFISHRIDIALFAKDKGYNVKVVFGELGNSNIKLLSNAGIEIIQVPLKRGCINPFYELITFINVWKVFRKIKPNIVHLVTIKPYLYGGIIAVLLKVPCVVSAVTGLGNLFNRKKIFVILLQFLLYPFFRLAFNHPNQKVIVQNFEDKNFFVKWGVLNTEKVSLIRGSGVNLNEFKQIKEVDSIPTICLASRLLYDKGIFDYINAAQILKSKSVKVRFWLAGNLDFENPNGIKKNELENICQKGIVEYLGYQKNISKLYSHSHVICLPSYYGEGIPKSLIEAAAAARAIVTTNHTGCKDAIIPNKTGLLVPIKNPKKLADAILFLIKNPKTRISMGLAGRKFAKENFGIEKIVQSHMEIYKKLLLNNP